MKNFPDEPTNNCQVNCPVHFDYIQFIFLFMLKVMYNIHRCLSFVSNKYA